MTQEFKDLIGAFGLSISRETREGEITTYHIEHVNSRGVLTGCHFDLCQHDGHPIKAQDLIHRIWTEGFNMGRNAGMDDAVERIRAVINGEL